MFFFFLFLFVSCTSGQINVSPLQAEQGPARGGALGAGPEHRPGSSSRAAADTQAQIVISDLVSAPRGAE